MKRFLLGAAATLLFLSPPEPALGAGPPKLGGSGGGSGAGVASVSAADPNVAQACVAEGTLHIDTDGVDADPDDAPHVYYCVAVGDPGTWARLDDKNLASIDASDITLDRWTPANDQVGQTLSEVIRGLGAAIEARQVVVFSANSSAHIGMPNAQNHALPVGRSGNPSAQVYTGTRSAFSGVNVHIGQLPFTANVYVDRVECTMGDTATWDAGDEVHLELVMDTGVPPGGTPTITQLGSDTVITGSTHPAGTRWTWPIGVATAEVTPNFALSILTNDVTDENSDADFILDVACWLYFGTIE